MPQTLLLRLPPNGQEEAEWLTLSEAGDSQSARQRGPLNLAFANWSIVSGEGHEDMGLPYGSVKVQSKRVTKSTHASWSRQSPRRFRRVGLIVPASQRIIDVTSGRGGPAANNREVP